MLAQTVHARAARLISVLIALGAAFCLPIAQAARAQAISPAQVVELIARPSGDTIQWGQFNIAPLTPFPTPQRFTSYGGVDGTIEVDNRGHAWTEEQCCPGNFDGNFANGDLLFDTANGAARLTLSFKQPLKSVGTQIAANVFSAFTAQIQAFNHNKLVGTFSENGIVTDLADNSAIFLGVMAPTAEITSVVYTVTIGTGFPGFAINEVTINQ